MSDTGLMVAGSVDVRNVSIASTSPRSFLQTITPQVVGIEIYEDIFSPFISGKIVVRDSQELLNLLPLVGEEKIILDIATPTIDEEYTIKGEFFIYKMGDRIRLSERDTGYQLYFMSKEGIIDINRKISKAYSGNITDIVKKIVVEEDGLGSKKNLNVETTPTNTKYISNFWSPVQNINYLAQAAINENNSPTYVFFENKFGLNFISLDSMYDLPVFRQLVWDNYTREITPAGAVKDLNKDWNRIINLNTPQTFDYIKRIQSGMYGTEMIMFDIMTKQYTHVGFVPDFSESKHLNKYPMWSGDAPASTRSTLIKEHRYYNNFDGYQDVTNTSHIQKRVSLMTQAEAFKLEVTVLGRTDYSAGQKINIDVPLNTQIRQETVDPQDKIYSGDYIISAICHKISRDSHQCVMELIKDSFVIDINTIRHQT